MPVTFDAGFVCNIKMYIYILYIWVVFYTVSAKPTPHTINDTEKEKNQNNINKRPTF